MATETTTVLHLRRQHRMRIVRVVVDVTGEATTTPVVRHVECVASLRLAEMAARTLFAEHRVGNAVSQRLEICRIARARCIVENGARLVDDSMAGLHQVAHDARYAIRMTTAAGAVSFGEVTRECDQSRVRPVLGR